MKHRLFVISAASGAGKTTLKNLVIQGFPDICYSISATTRSPREGEIDGVHYFFKTKEEAYEYYQLRKENLKEWVDDIGFNGEEGVYIARISKLITAELVLNEDGRGLHFEWEEETCDT